MFDVGPSWSTDKARGEGGGRQGSVTLQLWGWDRGEPLSSEHPCLNAGANVQSQVFSESASCRDVRREQLISVRCMQYTTYCGTSAGWSSAVI